MRRFYPLAAIIAAALPAFAAQPSAIYTNISALPNSAVPGGPGLTFGSFDRPTRSPNGQHWIMLARNTSGTATDGMYLTGAGNVGQLRVQEGVTPIEPGRTAENMSDRRLGINNSGNYGFTVNLTGATTDDQVAVFGVAGPTLHTVAFREGNVVGAAAPGWNYGSSMSDVNYSNGGNFALRATSLAGGTPSNQNGALVRDNGATATAQLNNAALRPSGVGARDWSALDFGSFYADEDGADWIAKGTITGDAASNEVVAVNNAVVVQEGQSLLGSTISDIIVNNMISNGDWFVRGENANDQAWVMRNGVILADSDDPVPGAPGENFSNSIWNVSSGNTFFLHTGNNIGDFIYAGFTDNADGGRNAVWVLNNSTVVLREGDQVDIDGDGLLDDAYIDVTGTGAASLDNKVDAAFLTDDLSFYFLADLRNAAGADLGEAFLRFQVPEPTSLSLLALAGLVAYRRR